MKPLSSRKRRLYVWLFVAIFFISVPLALLYAGGYRYKSGHGFVQTGGIFVSIPYSDAAVFLNGEERGRSNILNRNFYIDDLAAATYEANVIRQGMHPWTRILVVEPKLVTDVDVFLVPQTLNIAQVTASKTAASGTLQVSPQVFADYLAAFKKASATTTTSRLGTLQLEKGGVFLRWKKEEPVLPSIYCVRPSSCVNEVPVIGKEQGVSNAAFFSGVVAYTTRRGIFIKEADIRPGPIIIPLYERSGADFRIIDGHFVIKDKERLYEILDL